MKASRRFRQSAGFVALCAAADKHGWRLGIEANAAQITSVTAAKGKSRLSESARHVGLDRAAARLVERLEAVQKGQQ